MKYFLSLLALFLFFAAQANVIYVDKDSNALIPGGLSWNQAFRSFESAFNAAEPGDQIWVAEGTYYERSIKCGKNISVYCGFEGWETSVTQRDWENNVVTFSQSTANQPYLLYSILTFKSDGGTTGKIDGARFANWGFIYPLNALVKTATEIESFEVNNCSFSNSILDYHFIELSYWSEGGVIGEFNNCNFFNIQTEYKAYNNWEGSDFIYNDCSFDICRFGLGINDYNFRRTTFNATSFFACEMGTFAENNCAFNSCLIEGCEFTSASNSAIQNTDVFNCTFVNNDCERRLFANVNLYNSIVYGNTSAQGLEQLSNSQTTAFSCLLQEEFTGTGGNNSTADPLFEDPSSGDWSLSECSTGIDNGQLGMNVFLHDLIGNPRYVNNALDIGCIEFQGASRNIIYVNDSATGANNGRSWDDAFTQLQSALSVACENSEIWIARGTYYPNPTPASLNRFASFEVLVDTKIYGGFQGHETSIYERQPDMFGTSTRTALFGSNGTTTTNDDAYHILVISGAAENVVLDGLYFSYGRADAGFGTYGSGGALWMQNCSASINRCRFEANYALSGGAISVAGDVQMEIKNTELSFNTSANDGGAIKSAPIGNLYPEITIDRSWIYYNSANRGGGLNLGLGSCVISNSLFNENSATQNGGAIYSIGTLNLNNCTVYGHNEGLYISGTNTFNNSIFWNNTTNIVSAPNVISKTFAYCNLNETTPGQGNTTQDPDFIDAVNWNFNLAISSPLINSGNNDLVVGELDRAGSNRIFDGTVDKGAFEYSIPCAAPNDNCYNALEIDVSVINTVSVDMTCATSEDDDNVSDCENVDARSVWYHFVMPNHRVKIEFNEPFVDRTLSVFKGACNNLIGNYCGQDLLLSSPYIAPGADVYIKVSQWLVPDVISFTISPIIPIVTAVSLGQQDDCELGTPFSTYLQQIYVHYENAESFAYLQVNGLLYPLTGSPQLINMENVIADGDFLDLEVKFFESVDIFNYPNIVQTPCCAPLNDDCGNPVPIAFGIEQTGSLECASLGVDDVLSSCTLGLGRSLWYEFAAPPSGTVFLDGKILEIYTPINFRLSLWDLNDGCADPVEVACINNNGNNYNEYGEVSGLNPGQVYALMVSGYQDQSCRFSIEVTEVESTCFCTGDFNGDCEVNSGDLLSILGTFGCISNCTVDMNNDGVTNSGDLNAFLAIFGTNCIQ